MNQIIEYIILGSWLAVAASLIVIAVDVHQLSSVSNERFEAIESMNRVQQLQLNDLMYPGEYNGVH